MSVLLYPFVIVAVVVLGVKLLRINAKVLSREEFHTEASKRAKHLKRTDPVITCDYCGTKIDTSIHATCPNCGGTYEKDEEWHRRHDPNYQWADENAETVSDEKMEDARKKSTATLWKLRLAFVLLIVLPVLIFRSYSKRFKPYGMDKFRENEKPTEANYASFKRSNYGVEGDGVVFDTGELKVTLTGFYEREDKYQRELYGEVYAPVKLEFKVENKSKDDLHIRFRCAGANGVMSPYGTFDFFGNFRKNSTTTVYEQISHVRGGVVKEAVYGDVEVSNYKDYDFKQREYRRLKSNANVSLDVPKTFGTLKYEGNGVRIYSSEPTDPEARKKGYLLQIFNDTGTDLMVNSTEEGFGTSAEGMHIYRKPLPNGYAMMQAEIKSQKRDDPKPDFKISVSFSSKEDPSKDFSTGYFSVKP